MKKKLEYPLKMFKNKIVLKTVIHSVWLNFLLLSVAFEVDNYDSELFDKYNGIYTLLKILFNTYLSVCIFGYYISKNKVCAFTLTSFYAIVLMRITSLTFSLLNIEETTPYMILINRIAWLIILVPLTKSVLMKIKRNR